MPAFSIRFPYFIIVCCLITCVMGLVSLVRLPVDLFPQVHIPVVVVATFYNGMPAEDIETSISGRFERFFTLASGIDHMESSSLPGVSLIKVFFQPGTNPDSALTSLSNLAMADLRRLPPGTLPPVILKSDASSLPVCLVTLEAKGFEEATLRDLGQFNVRNQIASTPGAAIPPPFGGKYRQIMVYVDPLKLEAHQLSVMDVVRAINNSTLIMPSGDVVLGPIDYNLFSNSLVSAAAEINNIPIKTVGTSSVMLSDIGEAKDAAQIQTNIVRVDGQRSVYLPILRQGGDSNTIAIVDGVKNRLKSLLDVPKELITKVVFDQSIFVKKAIENLIHEGTIGLVLTALMVFIFLGSLRATLGVFFSIPLSVLGTFAILAMGDNSINSMILGGFALAFSRLIDNSVVVLENIYRHLENGETSLVAAQKGGQEVTLPVLSATLTASIVFFPVTLLYGVSKYLFSALALSVVISLLVSYVVALTVVPLFCSKYLHHAHAAPNASLMSRFNTWFNTKFDALLRTYDRYVIIVLKKPKHTLWGFLGLVIISSAMLPFLGLAYFPRTDPGQFMINLKAPSGSNVYVTEQEVKQVEEIIKRIVDKNDLDLIVSNIGLVSDFSAIYTSNTGTHSAFIQASLKENHKKSSFIYMDRVRETLHQEMPQLSIYMQTGGLVDSVLNLGLPAPIDIQIVGLNTKVTHKLATQIAEAVSELEGVSDVFIPQNIDAPALMLDVNREHASELGLSQREIVSNVITSLTSNLMIAPNYWVDPKTGNDYFLTIQYPEGYVKTLDDLKGIPIRAMGSPLTARLDSVIEVKPTVSPTVVNHYQLQRVIDVYVGSKTENLKIIGPQIRQIIDSTELPENVRINVRGAIEAMNHSFKSFGIGLLLSILLVYLILVAQFKSFIDPFIILLAVPPGLLGALATLIITGTTLNIMSLMGMVMLVGIAVSNSILILEFAHRLKREGLSVMDAVSTSCRVRLRPILMTSLATIIGLIPMGLALGAGSEAYASLARVVIGGLLISVILTVFLVPAAYVLIYGSKRSDTIDEGQTT